MRWRENWTKSLDKVKETPDISQIWDKSWVKLGNMRLIVLSGLVTVEKNVLALELADIFVAQGQRVTLIDNGQRLPVDEAGVPGAALVRLEGDLAGSLLPTLDSITSDVVLLAVSETVQPDVLFMLLDEVRQVRPDVEVQTLALIDTRTCDCFPQYRQSLEAYADVVVNLPVRAVEVVAKIV